MSVSPPGRRKNRTNLLRRPSFSPLSRTRDDDDTEKQPKKLLQKRRPGFTSLGLVRTSDQTGNVLVEGVEKDFSPDSPQGGKPSLLRRGRPASLFGSLKSFRTGDDETPPGTATSSKAPSLNWRDFGSQPEDTGKQKVLQKMPMLGMKSWLQLFPTPPATPPSRHSCSSLSALLDGDQELPGHMDYKIGEEDWLLAVSRASRIQGPRSYRLRRRLGCEDLDSLLI